MHYKQCFFRTRGRYGMRGAKVQADRARAVKMRAEGATLAEIGKVLGVSRQWVHRLLRDDHPEALDVARVCRQCRAAFVARRQHARFCSSACRNRYCGEERTPPRRCVRCGTPYRRQGRGRHCSPECRAAAPGG